MVSRKKCLQNFKLYAVTDLKTLETSFLKKAEAVLRGGVDILQLRSKVLSDAELVRVGRSLRVLTKRLGKLFFVNDRPDLCILLDADGVHIGQDDLPVKAVRQLVGRQRLIGKSTHSLVQAKATLREDVDYIGCGPIFATPTKPDYQEVGLKLLSKVQRIAKKPVVCIGGINLANAGKVREAGAGRIAVVRALWNAKDPRAAAQQFKKILTD